MGAVHNCGAHRAEQHPGEAPSAAVADHDQLCRFGFPQQMAGRIGIFNDPAHGDVRLAFLPTGQALGQRLVGRGLNGRPFDVGQVGPIGITQGVQSD